MLQVRYDKVKQKAYLGDFERIDKDLNESHGLTPVDNKNIATAGPISFQPSKDDMSSIFIRQVYIY